MTAEPNIAGMAVETSEAEKTARADLRSSGAYLVNVTGEGFLLMPQQSRTIEKVLDDKGMLDTVLRRTNEYYADVDRLHRQAWEGAAPVTNNSLAILSGRKDSLLKAFPEIKDLTVLGEISLERLEQIEAERTAGKPR